jgi:adenylate cyclase
MRALSISVRAKLAILVALPVVLMGAAVPLLSSVLRREVADAANDHVRSARRAFQADLEDNLADLELAARVMATAKKTQRALESGEFQHALDVAGVFAKLYPRLDITLALPDGTVIGDVGPTDTPDNITKIPELGPLTPGQEQRLFAENGCTAAGSHAPPAQAILMPVESQGWVLVCAPLDRGYLESAAVKLHVELAFANQALRSLTEHFPPEAITATDNQTALLDIGDNTWAVRRFHPKFLKTTSGAKLDVIAASDVTKLTGGVKKNFRATLAVLAIVAGLAVAFGAYVAGVMSRGLKQVIGAFKKLTKDEYIHVPVLKTRDELELLASGFNHMVDGLQERDKLRTTFGKYMTESVLAHLLSGKIALGGETLRVTILFSDIRSFTTISETMEAHALVALLNEYFTEMVSIVMQNNGVVDKYIGDAIMAVFGAPVPHERDAENAVRAAVEMRAALARLNERLVARGAQPLRTGIGIHTGDVVAGNIGSEQRMEYTVIGDPVNLASRLESNTKELKVDVLISEATYALVKDVVDARPVKEITVKGRAESVMTYEVRGLRDA